MSIADKLQTIAENVPKVYDSGHRKGYEQGGFAGYDAGYSEGHHLGQSLLWDAIQDGGNRTIYQRAFGYSKWNSDTFKPKYNISPTSAQELFRMSKVGDDTTKRIDLIKLEEETGFKFDFSNCTDLSFAFADAGCILTIGEVDLRKCTTGESLNLAFYGGYGGSAKTEIKKIICDENTAFHSTTFDYLTWLQEIRFEGTIGKTGITFARSTKLSYESLMSIINALQVLTDSGTTKTITLGATNLAKLTDAEKAIATQKGWSLT